MTEIDYTKLNEPDLLDEMGTDAMKWATAFCQINPDCGLDEGAMVTWFASAIMHALDTERGTIINGDHAQWLADRRKRRVKSAVSRVLRDPARSKKAMTAAGLDITGGPKRASIVGDD